MPITGLRLEPALNEFGPEGQRIEKFSSKGLELRIAQIWGREDDGDFVVKS